ncbi:TIGR02680 family protein [Leifsonia kafniensis]|uniref:TIGR02680 family protein n=1 Tax=Leifsonia kafniensis TaxID=475957 RepID=A0ABP7KU17_9MICO
MTLEDFSPSELPSPNDYGVGLAAEGVAEPESNSQLSQPTKERWQPMRLGLVDLFYYENEVFPFEDGRLLLRGNNGAGKSKVLALTLPFLLDGDLSARRVEPDGDAGKRMDWNLLLGGEHPNSERLGYTWLEFARLDDAGVAHFLTIGAGLKAAKGRGMTKNWFFITTQRVGGDLQLVDANRTALGRERLIEALSGHGRVYDNKTSYRIALDEHLFGLGERRYTALVDLLLQIRAPQLSKKPSERLLSDALTESLSPVGESVIRSVAEGLRSLDEERDELKQLTDAHKSVLSFLGHYRAYAQVLLKRQAEGPRSQQAEFDRLGREAIALSAQIEQSREQRTAADAELASLGMHQVEREAELSALQDSQYIEAERELAKAETAATDAGGRLVGATTRERGARVAAERAETELAAELDEVSSARLTVSRLLANAALKATEAGVAHEHGQLASGPRSAATSTDGVDTSEATDATDATSAALESSASPEAGSRGRLERDRASTRARIADARAALNRVQHLIDAVVNAASKVAEAERREAAAETKLAESVVVRVEADDAVETAIETYTSDVEIAVATLTELAVSDDEFAAFTEWVRAREGENPATLALRRTASAIMQALHGEKATIEQRQVDGQAGADLLIAEIASLTRGDFVEPKQSHTRLPSEGIPFWRAVGFNEEVSTLDRAGIEAALEGSGLLTAVLLPDGVARDAFSGEVLLRGDTSTAASASSSASAPAARTLAQVLHVELPESSGLSAVAVQGVLESIVLSDAAENSAAVWVSATGEFRLGAASGAWTTDAARFIGHTAREAQRIRRLAEAERELDAVHANLADLQSSVAELRRRLLTVQTEQNAVPLPTALEKAERRADIAAAAVDTTTAERDDARAGVRTVSVARDERAAELAVDAELLGLPTDAALLAVRRLALDDYDRCTLAFWNAVEHAITAERVFSAAQTRTADARIMLTDARTVRARADDDAREKTRYFEVLRDSVGDDIVTYRRQLAEVESALDTIAHDHKATGERRHAADLRCAVLDEKVSGIRTLQEGVASNRAHVVERLRATTALGLARVALPDLEHPSPAEEWPVTRGVQFARAIEQALAELDATDTRFDRLARQVQDEFTVLQRALNRHGHNAGAYSHDDGYEVTVLFQGRDVELVDLGDNLNSQLVDRNALLNARERQIIEDHLVTEVGAQLSELIGDADRQNAELNVELRDRPMSTGMTLRVLWKPRPDGPVGLAEARRVLGSTADAWSEADRTALGEFLQARIAEVRDADESINWYDHLGDALDYRRWHQFTVERRQAGVWKPATGPASGGERVLAASIPLFAAAASHYRTAGNVHAPRMVMLDEAFAGVDDTARASCLGLLTEFDLDVVMTSEREWGCYAEVPGLSIAQLSRFDDTPAVHVQLWKWDGTQRTAVQDVPVDDDSGALW